MVEYALHLNSLAPWEALVGAIAFAAILSFSILAARAQTRTWRAVNRFDGERRALQHRITLGKSHLR
ncbi:MAG: hypothetical protein PVI07_12850 [Anaerolineae bacterium]|jgi:hypothetical protein